ncbi:MAG: RrF2 family transcriptional regulator [Rickettsiales bacterium]
MSELLSKKTLLAMQVALCIACHGSREHPVKSATIVERYRLSPRALEPVLQTLSKAGIVESKQGATGGYVLPDADEVTLGQVARLFLAGNAKHHLPFDDWQTSLQPALAKAQEALLASLDKQKLQQLCDRARKKQELLPLTTAQPLDFTI